MNLPAESLTTRLMIGFAVELLKNFGRCRQVSEVHQTTNGHIVIIEDVPTGGTLKLIVEEVKSAKQVPPVCLADLGAPHFNGLNLN